MLKFLNNPDFGLLVLRLGLGVMMMCHGVPKFLAGASTLESIGKATGVIGIHYMPLFWGFMAALSETLGGFLIAIGFKTRLAALFLAMTMFMAFFMHYSKGDGINVYAHALELCIVFVSILFMGAGKFSVDRE